MIVIGDSDDTYDFSRLDRIVRPLDDGADLVMGSRLGGSIEPGAMPWLHRYLGTPVLSAVLNFFYGTRLVDTLSGFRAFRRTVFDRLDLRCPGMEWGSEMLVAAAQHRLRIVEVPIEYRARKGESKLRSFRDGWRYLRMLLMYSPTHLFILPGIVLGIIGAVMLLALLPGPVFIGGRPFDYHFMFVGSLCAILGTQVATLGIFARSARRAPTWFTLERGLVVGLLLAVLGLVANIRILAGWIASDFGPLDAVRPAIVALTAMVVGTQVLFSSFYLALLRIRQKP